MQISSLVHKHSVSASELLMHPKHKLSELLQSQMVLFTKAITIQIELEVVMLGGEGRR